VKPFQKILVATDFSPHSALALQLAADVSRRYDASVTLVHVYEPVAYALPEGYQLFTEPQLAELFRAFEQAACRTEAGSLGRWRAARRDATRERLCRHEICALASAGALT
jgi:nucleotide-binding universal stress UspA family protein